MKFEILEFQVQDGEDVEALRRPYHNTIILGRFHNKIMNLDSVNLISTEDEDLQSKFKEATIWFRIFTTHGTTPVSSVSKSLFNRYFCLSPLSFHRVNPSCGTLISTFLVQSHFSLRNIFAIFIPFCKPEVILVSRPEVQSNQSWCPKSFLLWICNLFGCST